MRPLYVTETPTTFRLQFDYNPSMVDCVKRIPTRMYDREDKVWVIRKDRQESFPLGRDARWYVQAFAAWAEGNRLVTSVKQAVSESDVIFDIPELTGINGEHYMLLEPYQYQLEGVQYALTHRRCIFGDQPGLGKTLQAICAVVKAHNEAQKYGETFPTLVICPASLKVNWQREFKKFSGQQAVILTDENRDTWHRYIEMKRSNGESLANVFITNYESLKKYFVRKITPGAKLTMRNIVFDERVSLFKSVIIDESHKCKSSKTQQAKFVEGICKNKRWVFELTGTPVVNNNTDLIQQLKILGRLEDFGGYTKFVDRYCDGPKQSSHIKELNGKLWSCCFFRREKQKVLTQLPEKTRQYITCPITNKREYDDAERDLLNYLRSYKNADEDKISRAMRGAVMVKMGLLKQISAKGKIKAVVDFVHDIIDGGDKLILFAYLKEVVAELKKHFPDAVTVTGSDDVAAKQRAVDSFQEDPNCKLIILNYKSGGTGLTLTASSRVAFIEFPWTYSDCEQAEDRAHRNGQKNNVNCYYFLGEGTIDEYMYNIIQTKREIADGVTGTETQIEEDIINMAVDMFGKKL